VGFLDDTDDAAIEPPTGAAGSLPILGGLDQLSAAAARSEAACVVFAFSRAPDRSLVPLVERCERLGLTVLVVPRLFETINCRMRLRHVDALPIGELQWVNPRSVQFAVKYALDRAAAAILTLVLAPLMLLIAALVRAGSPGPALYRQRRVGLDGREFTMFKFRTLRADPSPAPPSDLPPGCAPGGAEYAGQCTALGAWLRRSSLDELPQLFNVLRGEMSLVGPRPERPIYVHRFADEVSRYGRRHRVKSGITGLAQVSGLRGRTSIAERTRYDNFYIQNWSLWLDLKIALRTVASVLTLSGE
jgi:exopolysaccharide biosynthesis polyprenyl glycosylphosphotransferase